MLKVKNSLSPWQRNLLTDAYTKQTRFWKCQNVKRQFKSFFFFSNFLNENKLIFFSTQPLILFNSQSPKIFPKKKKVLKIYLRQSFFNISRFYLYYIIYLVFFCRRNYTKARSDCTLDKATTVTTLLSFSSLYKSSNHILLAHVHFSPFK